jgi:phage repressor protein C with HTH and peptisase S24 domain
MVNLDDIIGRLKRVSGIPQNKELADILGISSSDFSNRKKRGTLLPMIIDWAIHENVNLHWLVTGEEPEGKEGLKKESFSYIPLVGAQLSGGKGSFIVSEEVKEYCAFRTEWLFNSLGSPKGKYLLSVTGDSMTPTIQNGDTVMLDTTATHIFDGNIYALRMDDTILIKRLALRPGEKVLVISDNKEEYEPYEATRKDIHVLGRIVWFARTLVKSD